MHIKLTSLLVGLLSCVLFQPETTHAQTVQLSESHTITTGNVHGFSRPRIAFTDGNQPYLVWVKIGSPNAIYTSYWLDTSFSTPMKVGTNGINPMVTQSVGPNIASRNDTVYMSFFTKPVSNSGVFMMRSFDGGKTFGQPVRMVPPGPRPAFMPTMNIAPNGDPVAAFITTNTSWLTAFYEVARSKDGGATFEPALRASKVAPGEVCDCCPATLAFDGDNEYLMFRNNNQNLRDIWVANSTDRGQTYPNGADVDQTDWEISGCPSTGPDALISGDSLVSVWMSAADNSSRIYITSTHKVDLKTGTHTRLYNSVPTQANQNYPMIAGNGDTLGVVWQQSMEGKTSVFLAWSVNGIQDLFNQIIEIEPGSSKLYTPHIAFNSGVFHIVYSDEASKSVKYKEARVMGTAGVSKPRIESLQLTPNPSNNNTTLTFPYIFNGTVELISATGQVLRSIEVSDSDNIVLERNQLASGIYYLRTSSSVGDLSVKWFIE